MKGGDTQRRKYRSARDPHLHTIWVFFLLLAVHYLKTLTIHRTDCCFILWESRCLFFGSKNFGLSFDMGPSLWKVCLSCTFSFFHHQQYLWSGQKRLRLSPIWQVGGCIPLHKTLPTKFKNRPKKTAHWFGVGLVSLRVNRAGGFVEGRGGAPGWLSGW